MPKRPSYIARLKLSFRRWLLAREERVRNRYKRRVAHRRLKDRKRLEKLKAIEELWKNKQVGAFQKRLAMFMPGAYLYNGKQLVGLINSAAIFLIAYILVYFLYQLTVMGVASVWGLQSDLTYYDLAFNDASPLWTDMNILLVTFSGPLVSLLLSFFLLSLVFPSRRFYGLQRLLILWIALHGINHFLGALIAGIITGDGFGYVVGWLFLPGIFKLVIVLGALFALGILGFRLSSRFLDTSTSLQAVSREKRHSFLLSQAVLPWVLGSIIILLLRMPMNFAYPYETIMVFTMGVLIIPMRYNPHPRSRLRIKRKPARVRLFYLVLMLVLVLIYRMGF